MLNWWLILLAVLVSILCLGLGVYVLFYFKSNEDEGGSYGAQAVVVLGMVVAMGVVLLLPLDVANSPDPTVANVYLDTLNTQLMWQILLWSLLALTIVIVPFTMYYYEAYDPDCNRTGKQVAQAVLYTILGFGAFAMICSICYWKIGVAVLPVMTYEALPQFVDVEHGVHYKGTGTMVRTEISVNFFTYCIGILCFFGWIAFFFYGGVGLVSFPIDLIHGFIMRPKRISSSRFAQEMAVVGAKGDALLSLSLEMQQRCRGSISREMRSKINIMRNETYILEAQQDQLIWAYTKAGGSPFVVYGKLLLGIIAAIISLGWILHIFIYNTFNALPFLNDLLNVLEDTFALFSIIVYGVMTFYLMWATFEGQVRLGMRLVFFQIHPLKPHDTTLNSLLFNVSLCLFTSVAVIEFCARSFAEYAPRTAINGLMNVFVLHLKFIGEFIKWAQLLFVGIALLSIIWVILCPVKRRRTDPTKIRIAR